jgi:hypothetical protein
MLWLFTVITLLFSQLANADNIRSFPVHTIYANIVKLDNAQLEIEEIPSNAASSLLGMFLLKKQTLPLTPATIVRNQQNNNQVQNSLTNLINQPVAIQLDLQGRIWVVWWLTANETQWVIEHKYNIWQND